MEDERGQKGGQELADMCMCDSGSFSFLRSFPFVPSRLLFLFALSSGLSTAKNVVSGSGWWRALGSGRGFYTLLTVVIKDAH